MPDFRFILRTSDGLITQPRRLSEGIGRMEYRVRRTMVQLRALFGDTQAEALRDWGLQPLETREVMKFPNAKMPLTQNEKDRRREFVRRNRGQIEPPDRVIYYYRPIPDDDVVEQDVEFQGTPDPAWTGPLAAEDALDLRVNPPSGGP